MKEADPKGSVSCILYGDDELSEGSARVPLRFIHPSELRSFGSRSRGRGRPRSVRAFRQLSSDLHEWFFDYHYHALSIFLSDFCFMSDILSEIMRQRHQSPFYFCLSCGLQMEPLEAVIELYVSEAGFRLNRPFAAVHQSTITCKQCLC